MSEFQKSLHLNYLGFKSFNKREFGKNLGYLCRWRPILTPMISRLDNGDFLVTDRMMVKDSMFTRAMRTFDFNQDEKLDYIVIWNGNGKFDYDLLNYLASTTKVSQIQSTQSRSAIHSNRPREPYQAFGWIRVTA